MRIGTIITLAATLTLCLAACTTEESDLGANLVDPSNLYNSKTDTLYANAAYSMLEDSLVTSGGTYNIVGSYEDAIFGKTTASIYTQITLPSDDNGVSLAGAIVDSAVLCLVKDALFPDTSRTYRFHFEITPLAQQLETDTTYYGFSTLPVRTDIKYFDDTVSIGPRDTVIRFTLSNDIAPILAQNATTEEFLASAKGIRISIVENSPLLGASDGQGIVAFNFSATKTRLTAYFHYDGDTVGSQHTFIVGSGANRFMHFDHDYTGSTVGGADSIDGGQRLYLEPYGGYNIRLNFDSMQRAFHMAHPRAAIHYAELLLPLAPEAPDIHPDSLLAFYYNADGTITQLTDQRYGMGGDGAYNADKNLYRLRVSLYLQKLLREGTDYGTDLMLYYSRRHPAARTVLYGKDKSTGNPIKIVFTYTE